MKISSNAAGGSAVGVGSGIRTNVVAGIGILCRDRIWVARSLSRLLLMPYDVLGV